MKEEKIARINELARKKREEGLSPEEKEEQERLRREFIDSVLADVRRQLGPAQKKKSS